MKHAFRKLHVTCSDMHIWYAFCSKAHHGLTAMAFRLQLPFEHKWLCIANACSIT